MISDDRMSELQRMLEWGVRNRKIIGYPLFRVCNEEEVAAMKKLADECEDIAAYKITVVKPVACVICEDDDSIPECPCGMAMCDRCLMTYDNVCPGCGGRGT